jgi:DHA2 family multidrug resistance protein
LQQIGAKFAAANAGDVVHGHAVALRQLWSLTYREARVQTFADAFLAIAVCLAIATLLVPLLRKINAPAAPTADAH